MFDFVVTSKEEVIISTSSQSTGEEAILFAGNKVSVSVLRNDLQFLELQFESKLGENATDEDYVAEAKEKMRLILHFSA